MARKTRRGAKTRSTSGKWRAGGSAEGGASRPDRLDPFIEAGVKALGIPIKKAWTPSIRANLKVTLDHANLAGGLALPDDAEPAPVFKA